MIKHVEIKNLQGLMLRGYVNIPDGASRIVVMFHGYTGNKTEHNASFRTMSRKLADLNIASLRMDYACNGESDGEFIDFRFDQALDDARLMLNYAFNISNIQEVDVLGFSMGGAIASLVCNYKPIRRLLLWSPAADLAINLRRRYDNNEKDENGNIYSPAFPLSEALVKSMEKYDFYSEASKFLGKVFIIHGRNDKAVDYLCSARYATRFPNANLHIIDGAGHGYDEKSSFNELMAKSVDFLK